MLNFFFFIILFRVFVQRLLCFFFFIGDSTYKIFNDEQISLEAKIIITSAPIRVQRDYLSPFLFAVIKVAKQSA